MMKMQFFLLAVASLLFISVTSDHSESKVTNNPADQLVAVLNDNRTADHLPALYSNPGLACIALQYIKAYGGDCKSVGGPDGMKPADAEFSKTFAPKCNVEVSSLAQITGRFLACQAEYLKPDAAFSQLLVMNEKSLSILHSKNHTEVGAAVSGSAGSDTGPYFWCVFFSNGKSNSSFTIENGEPVVIRPGCFSGANDDCSGAVPSFDSNHLWKCILGALAVLAVSFGV